MAVSGSHRPPADDNLDTGVLAEDALLRMLRQERADIASSSAVAGTVEPAPISIAEYAQYYLKRLKRAPSTASGVSVSTAGPHGATSNVLRSSPTDPPSSSRSPSGRPPPSPSTSRALVYSRIRSASQTSIAAGLRLYESGVDMLRRRSKEQRQPSYYVELKEAAEVGQCSFVPKTNPKSSEIVVRSPSKKDLFRRLYEEATYRRSLEEERQRERERREREGVTGLPVVCVSQRLQSARRGASRSGGRPAGTPSVEEKMIQLASEQCQRRTHVDPTAACSRLFNEAAARDARARARETRRIADIDSAAMLPATRATSRRRHTVNQSDAPRAADSCVAHSHENATGARGGQQPEESEGHAVDESVANGSTAAAEDDTCSETSSVHYHVSES